jgi:hypothetical protein
MKQNRNTHHRKPRCLGGSNDPRNLVNVPENQHVSWHTLFEGRNPENICAFINAVWLDPDYKFTCVRVRKEEDKRQTSFDYY